MTTRTHWRWWANVLPLGRNLPDGRLVTNVRATWDAPDNWRVRDFTPLYRRLENGESERVGDVELLLCTTEQLRLGGTLWDDQVTGELVLALTSGALRPCVELIKHGYDGDPITFERGEVAAVMLGDLPAWPDARFTQVSWSAEALCDLPI